MPFNGFASAFIELIWVFSTYFYIITNHTLRRPLPIFKKTFKPSRNGSLLFHLAIPLFEVVRYHVQAVHGTVRSDFFDLLLCLAHSFTCYRLTKTRKFPHQLIMRPTFQTIITIRVLTAVIAFTSASPFWHRATIRILNAFVYPRLLVKSLGVLGILPNYSSTYTASTFVACILAVHDTEILFGPQIFMVMFVCNATLNRWVAVQISQSASKSLRYDVAQVLSSAGFANLKMAQHA
ncbi:uncharacterized protein BCR38DRAFT_522685 [Pseudomassariella vexata]|uniref:Uncharacterized protein n=1 Tax=Pseudomassariella vexata TaxID=1141098 RepID=A0A1Y2E2I3_9PEZI|nr:uncharacterized protein BCR38DRAFT_522685 [Pseudomassariella vexata]ORY65758.1 hypothetical protein BCR38DRAFT_522685 [Pseudomassariella vexata]